MATLSEALEGENVPALSKAMVYIHFALLGLAVLYLVAWAGMNLMNNDPHALGGPPNAWAWTGIVLLLLFASIMSVAKLRHIKKLINERNRNLGHIKGCPDYMVEEITEGNDTRCTTPYDTGDGPIYNANDLDGTNYEEKSFQLQRDINNTDIPEEICKNARAVIRNSNGGIQYPWAEYESKCEGIINRQ